MRKMIPFDDVIMNFYNIDYNHFIFGMEMAPMEKVCCVVCH